MSSRVKSRLLRPKTFCIRRVASDRQTGALRETQRAARSLAAERDSQTDKRTGGESGGADGAGSSRGESGALRGVPTPPAASVTSTSAACPGTASRHRTTGCRSRTPRPTSSHPTPSPAEACQLSRPPYATAACSRYQAAVFVETLGALCASAKLDPVWVGVGVGEARSALASNGRLPQPPPAPSRTNRMWWHVVRHPPTLRLKSSARHASGRPEPRRRLEVSKGVSRAHSCNRLPKIGPKILVGPDWGCTATLCTASAAGLSGLNVELKSVRQ